MKKRILKSIGVFLVAVIAAVILYINYIAPGITGYAAKNLASGVFVAGRTQASIEKEDINFFPVNHSKNYVDTVAREVTSKFLFWKAKAVYHDGLGCTLVKDYPVSKVRDLVYPGAPAFSGDADTIPWPAGDMVSDTLPAGIDISLLNSVLDNVFEDTVAYKGTFAVTVVYKDQIVAERFRSDMNKNMRFLSWSMAKSFTNAMVGAMVKEGLVSIDDTPEFKDWLKDERKDITLNNLMHMNSGLEFNEAYSKMKLTDATTMLLKHGDMGHYAEAKKLLAEPGTVWSYSSGSSNIIQLYLRNVFANDEEYLAYPGNAIFSKAGMRSVIWEVDASGTFVGSSYLYATVRDYARFGLLYLHNGNWMGEQILPEGWVDYTTTTAVGSDGEYGALFWLNKKNTFPGLPEDLYYCDGYDGQRIFVLPSEELVIVRTGCSPHGTIDWQKFLTDILSTLN